MPTDRPTIRVDAHHHVWDLSVRDQPWTHEVPTLRRSFDIEELRPQLAASGIDATVVVQTVCVPDETPELLALATSDPTVRAVVGWVDLTAGDVAERLAELRALPGGPTLVGVRHQVQEEPDPLWLCRSDVRRGLAAVGATGLAFDLLVTPSQLDAAVATARDLPQVRFVLDHAGKPPIASGAIEPWGSALAALSAFPNVAVKLSGLVTEADSSAWSVEQLRPFAQRILSAFGPQRTMFGSDWPVCTLAASYGEVMHTADALSADLSETERAEVFGGTAARWYGMAG
jgi:L-fuconolactonase